MPAWLLLLSHPRRVLDAAADGSRLLGAVLVVAMSGLVTLVLDSLASRVAPSALGAPTLVAFVAIPLLLIGFWLMSAWLVDTGARLMGAGGQRRRLLAATGQCYAVLAGYGLVGLFQALAFRLGSGDGVVTAIGLLGWVVLGGFIALISIAIAIVEELEPANALALALLPFATISAAVLLFVVVISALHAAGVV